MYDELRHHGILGQKWGIRRYQNSDGSLTTAGKKRYHSNSLSAYIAKKKNQKVDKGFNDWKRNAELKEKAISSGKKTNEANIAYIMNPTKDNKKAYKNSMKQYKRDLKENTTYRKGDIQSEVGKDLSRKLLSSAKSVQKRINNNPDDKTLNKLYSNLMNKHDIERARARDIPEKYHNRSKKIASIKRGMTMTTKAIAATAVIGVGVAATNKYLLKNKGISITNDSVKNAADKIKEMMKYI